MSLQPMMRSKLSGLKAEREDEQRCHQIQQIIQDIYSQVIRFAAGSTITLYKYDTRENKVIINNIVEILSGLQKIFPDSLIEYTQVAKGNDGQMYDISKMDEKMRPFINMNQCQKYIIIDWS
jgi:hypothetical protein